MIMKLFIPQLKLILSKQSETLGYLKLKYDKQLVSISSLTSYFAPPTTTPISQRSHRKGKLLVNNHKTLNHFDIISDKTLTKNFRHHTFLPSTGYSTKINNSGELRAFSSSNSHFRYNVTNNEWVAFPNENRKLRPRPNFDSDDKYTFKKNSNSKGYFESINCGLSLKRHDKTCSFCKGNESSLPNKLLSIITTTNQANQQSYKLHDSSPCREEDDLIVIPNKYPVVSPSHCILDPRIYGIDFYRDDPLSHCDDLVNCFTLAAKSGGIQTSVAAIGFHEVIIDSRDHSLPIKKQTSQFWLRLLIAAKSRILTLSESERIQSIQFFKNAGPLAGASMAHPHSQIVALPIIPEQQLNLLKIAENYYQIHNSCLFCDYISFEIKDTKRIILETEEFVAMVPYAASIPYQISVYPKAHSHQFANTDNFTLVKLSEVLEKVFFSLDCLLDNPDYNLLLRNAHFPKIGNAIPQEIFYHWYFEIFPRLDGWPVAGFEFGTGILCNSHFPEDDAKALRTCTLIDHKIW